MNHLQMASEMNKNIHHHVFTSVQEVTRKHRSLVIRMEVAMDSEPYLIIILGLGSGLAYC